MDHNARMMRIDRESIGQGEQYDELQPTSIPKIDPRFIGTRLDVCFDFELDTGGKELRWCQGSVKDILMDLICCIQMLVQNATKRGR